MQYVKFYNEYYITFKKVAKNNILNNIFEKH